MKMWIDPPAGWQYGFPKVYDDEKDGELATWLEREGYPEDPIYIRSWAYTEEKE